MPKPEIVIYTRAFCGYCAATRELLDTKGVSYREMDTTMDAALRREMQQRSGRKTVPQIFIDERHIGGYDELAQLDAAGKLNPLLGLDGNVDSQAESDE